MDIQALIFDLDGTAIPSQVGGMPSSAVIQTVQEAKKHCHVSIATGRPYAYAKSILEALGIDDVCILSGGAVVYSVKDKKNVWQQQMEPKDVEEVLHSLRHIVGDNMMETNEESFKKYSVNEFSYGYPMNMVCIYAMDRPTADTVIREVQKVSGFSAHAMGSWTPGLLDVHITHELATKKHAMQALLSIVNIDHSHTMVVGDGDNDLPLFELAGMKVAMGNASPKLIQAADWVAPTIENEGLAKAIERYIIKQN